MLSFLHNRNFSEKISWCIVHTGGTPTTPFRWVPKVILLVPPPILLGKVLHGSTICDHKRLLMGNVTSPKVTTLTYCIHCISLWIIPGYPLVYPMGYHCMTHYSYLGTIRLDTLSYPYFLLHYVFVAVIT